MLAQGVQSRGALADEIGGSAMKPPTPDFQNVHIIHLARRFVLLPFTIVRAVYRWLRTAVLSGRSDEQVRAADQTRQSRARRTLRGLPPDHVP
jgi:hypothetical protein